MKAPNELEKPNVTMRTSVLPATQSQARSPPSGNSSTTTLGPSSSPFSMSPSAGFLSSPQTEGAGEPTRVGASHSSLSRIESGREGQGVSPLRVRADDERDEDAGEVERLLEADEGEVEERKGGKTVGSAMSGRRRERRRGRRRGSEGGAREGSEVDGAWVARVACVSWCWW